MAKLWHSRLIPLLITATDAQDGYPAENLNNFSVAREWRAEDDGAKEIIIRLDDPADEGFLFIHAANFAACEISTSPDGVTYSAADPVTLHANDVGRYRGGYSWSDAGTEYIKVEIAATAPEDGRDYHACSSITGWAVEEDIHATEWGYQPVWIEPQVETELANKALATASTGIGFDLISVQWKVRPGETIDALLRKAREGVVIWTPDIEALPDQIWPVRWQDSRLARTQENLVQVAKSATLREVVI